MSFRKSARNQAFTVIYNEVAQHETMSMEARGVLMFMLSLPEDWVFHKNMAGIKVSLTKWGQVSEKVNQNTRRNWIDLGYLIRTAREF